MAFPIKSGKVAIPKLDRGPPPPPKPTPSQNREDRVTRACKNCRKRKVKCSGDIPRCTNCRTNSLGCVYEQTRRDRLKEATDLNHTFVSLFEHIRTQLTEEDQQKIQDVIDTAEEDIIQSSSIAPTLKSLGKRGRNHTVSQSPGPNSPTKKNGEAYVTASVGSNEDLDYLDEDLLRTRESRQTGYVGQNSEVQWLRSVQRQSQNEHDEPLNLPYGPPGSSTHDIDQRSRALHQRREEGGTAPVRHVTDATFYLDSDNIDLDIVVNPYELPDPEIAEQLLGCYMSTIHSSFPVVPQGFEDQARRFMSSVRQNRAFRVPERWRALLNLVFAIGARYSHLVDAEWQGPERDHLVYMTRASQLLGLNDSVALTSGPDLSLVQATATFALYFLVIGHVSRAWLTIGLSIRTAMSLGLHLRNEVPGTDTSKKETLEKTWWSLHLIETLVSSITGRPPTISIEDTTVPLPKGPPSDEQPASKRDTAQMSERRQSSTASSTNRDKYLVDNLTIALLTQRAMSSLYSPRTATKSWQDIQITIKDLLNELEDWYSHALGGVASPSGARRSQAVREDTLLEMHYWSTRLLITRPCLCRTERRIKNQSDASANFNSEMAGTCVGSARALTAMFPKRPDLEFIYKEAPWWNVVHVVMQCAAVLLLELGYQTQLTKKNNTEITSDIRKLIAWLDSIGRNDACAQRAYWVLQQILQDVAPHLRSKADELLAGAAASGIIEDHTCGSFIPPYSRQDLTANWVQDEFLSGAGTGSGHQQYPHNPDQVFQDPVLSSGRYSAQNSMPSNGNYMFNAVGNPFINSWDDDQPLSGLHNLWSFPNFPPADALDGAGNLYLQPQSEEQPQYQPSEYQSGSDSRLGDPQAHP